MVFVDGEAVVGLLECGIAHVFELGCDFENVFALPFLVADYLVFGEILVWVASDICDLLCGFIVVVA